MKLQKQQQQKNTQKVHYQQQQKKSLPYSKSSMLDGPSETSLLEILGKHPL